MQDKPGLSELARELVKTGYIELFHRLDDDALNAIWSRPGARAELRKLALDRSASELSRFLAAEILFRKLKSYPPASASSALVPVYARALGEEFTLMANPWSLPGSLDGLAAQHFLALGEAAIPELENLLGNRRELSYWGSKDATFGNSYKFRVKDVAASLLAALEGKQLALDREPARRDREIAKLWHVT